ncbi:hypothetical protein TNCV_185651 [Trichonephila clavipes]|nr:hypothetical protein TNCV_185651 [Trichonephila clavipes]
MQYHGVGRHHDQWPHAPTCGCEWTMTGQRYIDEVLLPHVCLFPWCCRQVAVRNYPPTNKNTLIRALTEKWDKLPQQLLDNVVQSMNVRESVADDKRFGRPQTSCTAENIEKVSVAVRKNRLQTIAESVGTSPASCQWILTKDLNMHKVCKDIVPRM